MCQFIFLSTGNSRNRNIIISRSRYKQNLIGLWIYNCDQIHITPARLTHFTIGINSTDINGKWFLGNTVICSTRISKIKLYTDIKCIQDLYLLTEIRHIFFHQTCVCSIINNSIHFLIQKLLCLSLY